MIFAVSERLNSIFLLPLRVNFHLCKLFRLPLIHVFWYFDYYFDIYDIYVTVAKLTLRDRRQHLVQVSRLRCGLCNCWFISAGLHADNSLTALYTVHSFFSVLFGKISSEMFSYTCHNCNWKELVSNLWPVLPPYATCVFIVLCLSLTWGRKNETLNMFISMCNG